MLSAAIACAPFTQITPVFAAQAVHAHPPVLSPVRARQLAVYEHYLARVILQRKRAARAVRAALSRRGAPYRWGATGPRSFDCSGLTGWAWRTAGIRLRRTAADQYAHLPVKVGRRHLMPGDLIFFYFPIHHVALYIGHGRFVHAPHTGDHVRVARLDRSRWSAFAGAARPGAPRRRSPPTWMSAYERTGGYDR